MKKIIVILIVGIFVTTGFGAFATENNNNTDFYLKKDLSFSNISLSSTQDGLIVDLEGTNTVLMKKDHYIVPTHVETFTFPFGTKITDVNCHPKNIYDQSITQELAVAPAPVLLDGTVSKNAVETIVNPISINQWFDYDVGVGLQGTDRCVIVSVQTYPIHYYQQESKIEYAESFEIEITYEEPDTALISDEAYKFIVLTPTEFKNELSEFITHKNNRNISTKLITLDEIYGGTYFTAQGRDEAEKIKYFIKNAIEQWGVTDVMLVGGYGKFPIRETHVFVNYGDGDSEIFASDLYFADIYNETSQFASWDTNENDVFGEYDWADVFDEVDLYPDVHLGRLACLSADEVTGSVNKIITYETTEAYTKDWFTNLIVVGGDTSPEDEDGVDEGEAVNQKIIDLMDEFIPTKCWASEGTLSKRSFISDAFKDGAGFVDFSGHGNPTVWSTHPHDTESVWIPVGGFRNSDVLSLNNGDMLPVVITGACSVAKFIEEEECFTWAFVLNPIGGGIGSIGPSSLSWGYTGSWATRGLGGKMQIELFTAYSDRGAITFGEMWLRGISNYIYPNMDGGDHKVIEQWQPFGDPTLSIAGESQPPVTPDAPEGPPSGKTEELQTFTASTTDPDGDQLLYLFDWGDETYSEWIGPVDSGDSVEASHNWAEDGDYEIRVKAKDDHGVQSEWSDPVIISMPKSKTYAHSLLFSFLEQYFSSLLTFLA